MRDHRKLSPRRRLLRRPLRLWSSERQGLREVTHLRRSRLLLLVELLRSRRSRTRALRWTWELPSWEGTPITITVLMDRTTETSSLTDLRPRFTPPQVEDRLWAIFSAEAKCEMFKWNEVFPRLCLYDLVKCILQQVLVG